MSSLALNRTADCTTFLESEFFYTCFSVLNLAYTEFIIPTDMLPGCNLKKFV